MKNEKCKKGIHTKSKVIYVKRAAATTRRTKDQGNQNPKLILKTTMTQSERIWVLFINTT